MQTRQPPQCASVEYWYVRSGDFCCSLNISLVTTTISTNTFSISFFVSGEDLTTFFDICCNLLAISSKWLLTTVPAISLAAPVTVCPVKTRSVKNSAASFSTVTMNSVNAVSYDLDFTSTSGATRPRAHSGSSSAATRSDLVACVMHWWVRYSSIASFDVRSNDAIELSLTHQR